jgi:cytosine/creatinine deaminase
MEEADLDLIIRNARVRGSEKLQDIGIERGKIAALGEHLGQKGRDEIDAAGRLTSSAFVNPHVHLDKTLLGERMWAYGSSVFKDFETAIRVTNDFKRRYTTEDIKARACKVLESAATFGTTVTVTCVDVGTMGGLIPVQAMLEVKEAVEDIMELHIVAFPQEGIIRDPGAEALLYEAMELGADIAGGLPWYEMTDKDARRHVDIVFKIARKFDAPILMLVDDTDDANSRSLEYLAVKTIREGYQGRVTACHCGALAACNDTYAAKVIALVKEAGITICSNSHISLWVSGLLDRQPIRRGITRVKEFLAAGVNVACGQDDVNDPYYPFGKPDPLEIAFMMAHVAHLRVPDELEKVFDMVTVNAATSAGLRDYGLSVGSRADLVIIDAPSVHEALRWQPDRSYVIKGGKIISRASSKRELIRNTKSA